MKSLLWISDNLGLGQKVEDCRVAVKENGVLADWSVQQALARIDEFSTEARQRILAGCMCQMRST